MEATESGYGAGTERAGMGGQHTAEGQAHLVKKMCEGNVEQVIQLSATSGLTYGSRR